MKSKIFEIIKREYITRVRKRSFIIMTIFLPLILLLVLFLPYLITNLKSGVHKIAIVDQSGLFKDKIKSSRTIKFTFVNSDLESMKKNYKLSFEGFLYIPQIDIHRPIGITYYSEKQPGLMVLKYLENQVENVIKNQKLKELGLDKEFLKKLNAPIDINTVYLSGGKEENKNSKVAASLSYILGFILYILLSTYGSMVMKGVQEEKSNKIVEIIISSVKPVQLMLGKIIGLALVALTQIVIWILLFALLMVFFTAWMLPNMLNTNIDTIDNANTHQTDFEQFVSAIKSLDFGLLTLMFIIFAIGGYLFYSSVFAAVGSISDETSENQSFVIVLMLPIFLSFIIVALVMEQPNSPIVFWASLIPYFSPLVMMARIPFGVPSWQLVLSVILLVVGIYINIIISAKIYRTAILLTGKRVNIKEIFKWVFHK